MKMGRSPRRVAGIDVGGSRKGFHAVALENGVFLDRWQTRCPRDLGRWLRDRVDARIVAVDAPCRWSGDKSGRAAERELLRRGIRCFLTPTRRAAGQHPANYYDWMLRGAALFRELEKTHPLCRAMPRGLRRCCFETFPHAITWHLRGGQADAARKRGQRMALLREYGCDVRALPGMDWIDAALCAMAADMVAAGCAAVFCGDEHTGFIVVPDLPRSVRIPAGKKRLARSPAKRIPARRKAV